MTFEGALRALGIDASVGPTGARFAYERLKRTAGTRELRKRLDQAWDVLQDPAMWRVAQAQAEVEGSGSTSAPGPASEAPAAARGPEVSTPSSARSSAGGGRASVRGLLPDPPRGGPGVAPRRTRSEPDLIGPDLLQDSARGRRPTAYPEAHADVPSSAGWAQGPASAGRPAPPSDGSFGPPPGPGASVASAAPAWSASPVPGSPARPAASPGAEPRAQPTAQPTTPRSPAAAAAAAVAAAGGTERSEPTSPLAGNESARPRGSAQQELSVALQGIDLSHPGALDTPAFHEAVTSGKVDCLAPVLARMLTEGNYEAAAAAAVAALKLITGRPERRWLEPRSATRLILHLYEAAKGDQQLFEAGRSVLWELDRWQAATGDAGVWDTPTTARWRWAQELAGLPADFPAAIKTPIIKAAAKGDLSLARPQIADAARKMPEAAVRARGVLVVSAREIAGAVADLLPAHAKASARKGSPQGQRSAAPSPSHRSARSSLPDSLTAAVEAAVVPAWVRPAMIAAGLTGLIGLAWTGLRDDDLLSDLDPQLLIARTDICRALGDQGSACVFATVAAKGVDSLDCGLVEEAMPRLRSELTRHRELGGGVYQSAETDMHGRVDGAMSLLESRAASACPGGVAAQGGEDLAE